MNTDRNFLIKRIISFFDKLVWITILWIRRPLIFLPDYFYIKHQYRRKTGKKLNLKKLETYNEKLQWLKLYDRNPEYTNLVDKYQVRKYVAENAGAEYLIPVYGVWDYFDDIDFDTLPDQFVLKCTHDSGSVVICKDKNDFNIPEMRKFFRKRLAVNFFWTKREWVYKNIKPRIMAEKLMVDESGSILKDYKFYCFNGVPKIIEVIFDRFTKEPKENFYTLDWKYQHFTNGNFTAAPNVNIEKPRCFEKMLEIVRKLSAGKIHVRVDLYEIGGKIYFGELTFFNVSGYGFFNPPVWDKIFGDWITLPIDNNLYTN